MKNTKLRNRIVSLLLMLVMIATSQSLAFAETVPANDNSAALDVDTTIVGAVEAPTNIKYELSGACDNITAKITWDSAGDDAKYAVQVMNNTPVTDITTCSYSLKGLTNTASYTIKVGAYITADQISWNEAEQIVIKPFTVPTAQITGISKPKSKDNIITIRWELTDVEHLSKLRLVRNSTLSTTFTEPTTQYTFHAVGGVNTYYIRAYSVDHSKVYSVSNGMDSSKVPSYLTYVRKKFVWRATFKKKATVYKSKTGSSKLTTCKKSTVAEAIGKYPKSLGPWEYPKRVEIKLEDGRTGWVAYSSVKIKGLINTSKDYALSSKLEFVDNYDSDTKYLVWVNQYTMRVNIFKGKKGDWKLVRTKRVVVGEFRKPLSYGSGYTLGNKVGRIYRLNEEGRVYYFDLARGFHGSGYFHTRCKWENGSYRNSICSKPNTRGCIRMYNEDAQYIWDLPRDTRVVIR